MVRKRSPLHPGFSTSRKEDNAVGTTEVVVIGLIIVASAVAVLYFIRRNNA